MQKRTKLALFLIIGLILLALGIYIFISPFLPQKTTEAPPALPNSVPQANGVRSNQQPGYQPPSATNTAPVAPITSNEAKLRAIENRASVLMERIGSGSSATGFLGYVDAMSDVTSNGATYLQQERQRMQAAHPATGSVYGISTRTVSSHAKPDATFGDASLTVTVEAIQTEDAGDPRKPTSRSGKRLEITFAKQADGSYLADAFAWTDLPL